jgi:hypothetical protein
MIKVSNNMKILYFVPHPFFKPYLDGGWYFVMYPKCKYCNISLCNIYIQGPHCIIIRMLIHTLFALNHDDQNGLNKITIEGIKSSSGGICFQWNVTIFHFIGFCMKQLTSYNPHILMDFSKFYYNIK